MLIAAAHREASSLEMPLWPSAKRDLFEASVREQLTVDDWAGACERGNAMSRDEALRLAAESARPKSD
jgi:hypothetical protein